MLKSSQFFKDNVIGFLNLLEGCKIKMPAHLLYASSSAVYGNHKKAPFSEKDDSDNPASFYGVTKKANEIMAFTFSNLNIIRVIGRSARLPLEFQLSSQVLLTRDDSSQNGLFILVFILVLCDIHFDRTARQRRCARASRRGFAAAFPRARSCGDVLC